MDRKGISEMVLIGLIVLLASAIVMGYATGIIAGMIKGKSDVEMCRTSVELNAQSILNEQIFSTAINCPSDNITIKDVKKAKETIANSMYDCWYKFGEYKLDFIKSKYGKYCYLCSKIDFDESLAKKNLVDFGDYLENKKIQGTDKSYLSLFWPVMYEPLPKEISMSEPFYIIYAMDKTIYVPPVGIKTTLKNVGSGCAIGGAIGLAGGIAGAAPGCIIGAGIYGGSGLVYNYFIQDKVKFNPSIWLVWGQDDISDICMGDTTPFDKFLTGSISGINSLVPEGEYDTEHAIA